MSRIFSEYANDYRIIAMFVLKSKKKASAYSYIHELLCCVYAVMIFFVACALVSYTPTDSSLLYYRSDGYVVTNWCGSLGANCAVIAWYFFGAAALLLIPAFCCMWYLKWHMVRWRSDWERVFGICLFVISGTVLFALHGLYLRATLAGGLFGQQGAYYSMRLFGDVVGAYLLWYCLLLVSIVLITNVSFITLLCTIAYSIQKVCTSGVWKIGISFAIKASMNILKSIVIVWMYLWRLMWSVLDGSFFDSTGLVVPAQWSEIKDIPHTVLDVHPEGIYQKPSQNDVLVCATSHVESLDSALVSIPKKTSLQKNDSTYQLPQATLLQQAAPDRNEHLKKKDLEQRAKILEQKLERFGIYGAVVHIKTGPVVTLFEYEPAADTKLSKIVALEDDLALALQAMSIRILAPIPGTSVVGFEVANNDRKDVFFSSLFSCTEYQQGIARLPLVLGEDTVGSKVIADLARMPHLLVAGSTGSGKSVALNAMLVSLIGKLSPAQLRLILIDPKRLEFAPYADIPHLLFPIVTQVQQAPLILRWVVKTMEDRYSTMAQAGVRNINDYHVAAVVHPEWEALPYIVVIIDELADLMMTVGRDVEDLITRITQMARAAGIHMIVATQRPSVDVITGLIKVNFPSRISFRVTSKVDSRTILDTVGAEKLLGRGDMLFIDSSSAGLRRVHGAYISDAEIGRIVSHLRAQQPTSYLDIQELNVQNTLLGADQEDSMYQDILNFVRTQDEVSISLLQRKFRIGYNRSARLIDQLQMQGIILSSDNGKTRKVVR
jgi:hypothetical protein